MAENVEPFDYRSVSFPNRKVNIKANFDKQRSLYKSIVTKTVTNPEIANSQAINLHKAKYGSQFAPSSPSRVRNYKSLKSQLQPKSKSSSRLEIK